MGRKKKSGADAVLELVSLLPWWAGIGLALLSWFLFGAVADHAPKPTAQAPGQMSNFVLWTMASSIAVGLKYILPPLCLLGALVSFTRTSRRQELLASATESSGAAAVDGMTWREFEMLVGETFRLQGFSVEENRSGGPDGGVDLVLRKGTETFLVQCKQWKAFKVGVDVVRELYGVMAARGAAGGYVVTSGQFTGEAQAFASGRNVRLVDGKLLPALLQQATTSVRKVAATTPAETRAAPAAAVAPSCPKCDAAMVRRTARQGATAGAEFWGCSRFPGCRGTRA